MPRKSEVGRARLEPQRCDTRGPIPRPQLEFLLRHPDGSSGFCSVQRRGNLLSLNETHAVFLSFSSRLRIPPQSKERCLLVASSFCGALSKSEQISRICRKLVSCSQCDRSILFAFAFHFSSSVVVALGQRPRERFLCGQAAVFPDSARGRVQWMYTACAYRDDSSVRSSEK